MLSSLPSSSKALALCCVVLLGLLWPAAASGQDIQLSSLNGTNGLVIHGRDPYDISGVSVSSGDINGDGYADILIGEPHAGGSSNSVSDAGVTCVVFGKASGWAASMNVSSLDGTNGLVIHGRDSGDQSGSSVSSGDINGDGYADLLIGASSAVGSSNSAPYAGETYVVFGKGLASPPSMYNASYAPWLSDAVTQAFALHAECSETRSWTQILAEFRGAATNADRYTSGGLGTLGIKGRFGIWVCWRNHPCVGAVGAAAGDRMCYVKNMVTDEWHPWGLNSVLQLCGH